MDFDYRYTSQHSAQVLGFDDMGHFYPLPGRQASSCLGRPSDSRPPTTPLPLDNTPP